MLLPSTERRLQHRVARAQSEGRAPSLVAAVTRDGEVVFRQAIETDLETQFRIGSLTKTFVAVLIMRLRDEGRLGLNDTLETHVAGTHFGHLTIAQLLSHTSGLASETPGPWWERTPGDLRPELADILGDDPAKFDPGRRFHYSNPGFALLGAVVESLRGVPWGEALQREVLDPLGMSRTSLLPQAPHATGWAVHPWADVVQPEVVQETGRMGPAGQLWSTVDDLCRFADLLASGHPEVLSAETVAQMRLPAAPPEEASMDAAYGLGMQTLQAGGRHLAGHTGSMPGFLCALWINVPEGLAAIMLANTTSGLPIGQTAAELLAIVADNEPRIPAPWRPMTNVDGEALELAGLWYWGPTAFAVRLHADGTLEATGVTRSGPGAKFRKRDDGTWIGLNGYYSGETLRPMRDGDGQLTHLDLGSFILTRQPYDPSAPVPGGVDPDGWTGVRSGA